MFQTGDKVKVIQPKSDHDPSFDLEPGIYTVSVSTINGNMVRLVEASTDKKSKFYSSRRFKKASLPTLQKLAFKVLKKMEK